MLVTCNYYYDKCHNGGGWNHINRFNDVIFLSLSQGHEFSTSYVRVIVCFVDISGIVDQHCLSLLIIMIRIRFKAINRRGKFWCWDGVWMNDLTTQTSVGLTNTTLLEDNLQQLLMSHI
jgi:hypothetical protein